MTTTLYLISVANWYIFSTFETAEQVNKCLIVKEYIEATYPVEAVCITKLKSNKVIIDNRRQIKKLT
tara:strand:+ start:319 stop:519 length:201 start_codon:yes stop_codon:yes gene_type:complete